MGQDETGLEVTMESTPDADPSSPEEDEDDTDETEDEEPEPETLSFVIQLSSTSWGGDQSDILKGAIIDLLASQDIDGIVYVTDVDGIEQLSVTLTVEVNTVNNELIDYLGTETFATDLQASVGEDVMTIEEVILGGGGGLDDGAGEDRGGLPKPV